MPVKQFLLLAGFWLTSGLALAENGQETGYLEYQEPLAATGSSPVSTFLYVVSLVAVFLFVLAGAYLASRYLGGKMGARGAFGGQKILGVLPLAQNKNIAFVEVLSSVLVLGVTESNISLLKEISTPEDIEKIKADLQANGQETLLFSQHRKSLNDLQGKFGPFLRKLPGGSKGDVR